MDLASTHTSGSEQLDTTATAVFHIVGRWEKLKYTLRMQKGVTALCGVWVTQDSHLPEDSPTCPWCQEIDGWETDTRDGNHWPITRRG
jgi:hypothetical protein